MVLKQLTQAELQKNSVADLGLDASILDLATVEVVSALLRRAAIGRCPCPQRTLVNAILDSLRGIAVANQQHFQNLVEDTLEALVNYGDFLELEDAETTAYRGTLLFVAPPAFIVRASGVFILIGGSEELPNLLSENEGSIESVGHVRRLLINSNPLAVKERLLARGVMEMQSHLWFRPPSSETANDYLSRIDVLLNSAPPSGAISNLLILDPQTPTKYYRGRWQNPHNHTGKFVARRPQAFGADLWCYVELVNGVSKKFIDLPVDKTNRACDDGWRIQLAIDASRDTPQRYRLRAGQGSTHLMDFFGPIPAWMQRRLDAVARPVPTRDALFSYGIDDSELPEEMESLKKNLWLLPE